MRQSSLFGLVEPAVVCVADVCGDYVCSDVTHGSDVAYATCLQAKFSRAPEMPFAEVLAQPGMLPEEAEGASAFEHLQRLGDAHGGLQIHKHMHMVAFDLQLENLHPVFLGDLAQETLAVVSDHCELERIPRVLGLCQQACPLGTFIFSRVRAQNFA